VGLRGGQPDDPRLLVRSVSAVQMLVCASPAYLAQHGTPARWEDLARHRLTGYRKSTTGRLMAWERRLPGGEIVHDDLPVSFTCNHVATELQAVLAGVGIGQLASFSAVPHLRSGALKLLFPESITAQYQLFLYRLRRDRMPARVRAVFEFLSERLVGHPDLALSEAELQAFSAAPAVPAPTRPAKKPARQRPLRAEPAPAPALAPAVRPVRVPRSA
jgi:DNA-binding transcriptional LysR family regulator